MNDGIFELVDNGSSSPISITFGPYTERVDEKHEAKYGSAGMLKTRNAAKRILRESLEQITDPHRTNNVLLVGKVQSGKTSNLESLIALGCDNGFNLFIIYAGKDNTLVGQTVNRFRGIFGIPEDPTEVDDLSDLDSPILFSTVPSDKCYLSEQLDEDLLLDFMEEDIPVILATLKRPDRLGQINDILERSDLSNVKAMIIDDEGDQASLNCVKEKDSEASATYAQIRRMKDALGDPLYYSVTATPQANIFLNELSVLRPSSIKLLYPAEGYCGAELFHINENRIISPIEEDTSEYLELGTSPDSLKESVAEFMLASVLYLRKGVRRSDMIVHIHQLTKSHDIIYRWVESYIEDIKGAVEDALGGDISVAEAVFAPVYKKHFTAEQREANPLDLDFLYDLSKVLKKCAPVLHNGPGKETQGAGRWKNHRIYIGANLLERGVTFDNLLTTYFARWAKSGGNMDTNLQRARWFGYREKFLDICKVFMPQSIANEYNFLAEMEEDLWIQFAEVEAGTKPIEDIIVYAENTKQKPTRNNVVTYFALTADDWMKQSYATFAHDEIEANRRSVEYFIASLDFEEASLARSDGENNCLVASTSGAAVAELFSSLAGIFDNKKFRQKDLTTQLKDQQTCAIVQMFLGKNRERSFWEGGDSCKIKALQQGRTADAKAYLGDRSVIVPGHAVTVQIYSITPIRGEKVEHENTQHMFAIYFSDHQHLGYMRG